MITSTIVRRAVALGWILFAGCVFPAAAQLSADWMIPAAASNAGARNTFWRTDLSLHNPHEYDLPVVVQALPSDTVNDAVPTLEFTLAPWQTLNLWDVLGPDVFDLEGTAAILAYADPGLACDPIEDCRFLATSRTYTPDATGFGEFGLTVFGAGVERGTDWETIAYAAGVLNDGGFFRCNVGVASWSAEWTRVRLDVQGAEGVILASEFFDVPPFGHVQRRLDTALEGGSLVFYLQSGPDNALIFPYATVINQETGDPSYVFAEASLVGASVAKKAPREKGRPNRPRAAGSIPE
jgi:hypothetical protein